MSVEPGLSGEASLTVAEGDIATAFGTGDVPVLATPRVVALCEQAALAALDGQLQEGQTSVGTTVQVSHVAPSGVGEVVKAEATVERVDGRRIMFTVSVSDNRGLVAAGKVGRVVVDRQRFLERLA